MRWDALVAIYLALRRSFFCEVSPVTHCRCHGSPITSRVWPPLTHDANFAPEARNDRKSTSGYCFWFLCCLICWKSKLQPIVTASTHASELVAANFAGDEALWLRRLVLEIGFVFKLPDNTEHCNCNIVFIGTIKFRPVEKQALEALCYHNPEWLREFTQTYLLPESSNEHKLMMTITPLPDERFASLDTGTRINHTIDRAKAMFTMSTKSSTVSQHEHRSLYGSSSVTAIQPKATQQESSA